MLGTIWQEWGWGGAGEEGDTEENPRMGGGPECSHFEGDEISWVIYTGLGGLSSSETQGRRKTGAGRQTAAEGEGRNGREVRFSSRPSFPSVPRSSPASPRMGGR